jgi:hypothetical protein
VLPSTNFFFDGLFIIQNRVFFGSLALSLYIERRLDQVVRCHHLTCHPELRVRAIGSSSLSKLFLLRKTVTCAVLSSYKSAARVLSTDQLSWHKPTVTTLITLFEVLSCTELEASRVLILRVFFRSLSLRVNKIIISKPKRSSLEIRSVIVLAIHASSVALIMSRLKLSLVLLRYLLALPLNWVRGD